MSAQRDHDGRYGIRSLLRRTAETLRHEGIGSFLRRTLAWFGYASGSWYVGWYVRPLDAPIESVDAKIETQMAELGRDDYPEFAALRPGLSRDAYQDRLGQQQTCFAVRSAAGELASVTWVAVGRVHIDFVGREIELRDDEIYLYESYTAVPFRGRRLQPFLCAHILDKYRDRGYRRAIVIVGPENRSNIASRERSGFVRTGRLVRIRAPWRQYDFFRGVR